MIFQRHQTILVEIAVAWKLQSQKTNIVHTGLLKIIKKYDLHCAWHTHYLCLQIQTAIIMRKACPELGWELLPILPKSQAIEAQNKGRFFMIFIEEKMLLRIVCQAVGICHFCVFCKNNLKINYYYCFKTYWNCVLGSFMWLLHHTILLQIYD